MLRSNSIEFAFGVRRGGESQLSGLAARKPWLAAWALLLAGCASAPSHSTAMGLSAEAATQWHAPLPHSGQLAKLHRWWAQFDDPLMLRLIEAGQRASPTVAQAVARIANASATRVAQNATLLPSLDATAEASRGRSVMGPPMGSMTTTSSQAALRASWELDIFGAVRAGARAAQARIESSQAGWHDARISVAAEVATTYVELRACEAQVEQAERDAGSREQTARSTRMAAQAGFQPQASAELANAQSTQSHYSLIQQRMQCDLLIKSLSTLTAEDETSLRRDLFSRSGQLPRPVELDVAAVPAQMLAQRPDVFAATRELVAASADAEQARKQRWPRVTLSGNIGMTRVDSGGISTDGQAWSIGPVTITLPLFDGGTRRANARAARARFDAAVVIHSARVREAVRDVENALVILHSTAIRGDDTQVTAHSFQRAYEAAEASYRAGTTSLLELEVARRSLLDAQKSVIELQRERVCAWIALYRALGGGWQDDRDASSS